MPAIPPSDEPSLPKLRRFRFDSENPEIAREVDEHGNAVVDDGPGPQIDDSDDSHTPPAASDVEPDATLLNTAPGHSGKPDFARPNADLRGSGRLDANRPATEQRDATRPDSPGSRRLDSRGVQSRGLDSPEPVSAESRRAPVTGPVSGQQAGRGRAPHTGPTPAAAPAPQPGTEPSSTRRSTWPFAIAGVAAALVIGLVAWFVLMPDDKESSAGGSSSEQSVSDWAAGICSELTDYQTAAMPLRAEIAKATGLNLTGKQLAALERQSSELLSSLASDVQDVGMPPSGTKAADAHTTIISALSAAAKAGTGSSSGGSTSGGSTSESAGSDDPDADLDDEATPNLTAILSALDRPGDIFKEAVAGLPTDEREEVTEQAECTPLL